MLVAEELQLGSFLKYLGQYLRSDLEREQYEGAEADALIPSWWKGLAIGASSRGRGGGRRTRSGVSVLVYSHLMLPTVSGGRQHRSIVGFVRLESTVPV